MSMFIRAISVMILMFVSLVSSANQPLVRTVQPESAKPVLVMPEQRALIEQWGVEALKVTLTANDYMVDFRYKVIDAKKAATVVNPKDQPFIHQSSTGLTRVVPAPANVGALRHTGKNLKAGKNYFVLFANPEKTIKRGDKITLVMGKYKLENVTVQ